MKAGRVGYFGGTFDPPHLGHLILAVEAQYRLALDSLKWILTPDPPHKKGIEITSPQTRLEMLRLVIKDQPGFAISTVEIDRKPPHYAADTVEILKGNDPAGTLIYIIGEDSLHDLPNWVDPGRFLAAVDRLAVASRPGVSPDLEALEKRLPGLTAKVVWLEGVKVEISSSLVRERIRTGDPYRHFLREPVADYIDEHRLYIHLD